MTKDTNSQGLDGVFARHDAALDAEQERLLAEMVELKVRMAIFEREQAALRRSKMSALEKSRYIRAHGKPAYDLLRW